MTETKTVPDVKDCKLVTGSTKSIIVRFDELFNNTELSVMNEFTINKKRNFIPLTNSIVKILNYVFSNRDGKEIALKYLELKCKIYKKYNKQKEYPESKFIKHVFEYIITPEVKTHISQYVEDSYKIDLDNKSSKNKTSINKELQFTDKHAKVILKSSMLMKYVIPVIMTYITLFNIKNIDSLLYDIFSQFFTEFSDSSLNILNKIFKLIESRVTSTNYSDRIIWLYLQNIGITSDTLTRNLNRKIISNIIAKIENNTNVISFLHVVIKNSIRYQFTFKFPISYKSINLNEVDSEGLTDFDRLEINMTRSDESLYIINDLTIRNIMDQFKSKYNIEVNEDELDYYKSCIMINNIQINYLFLFFSKYTKNYRLLFNSNYHTYMHLLIIFEKWLKLHNFNLLAEYMVAIPEKIYERKPVNKKQILNKIINFNKYEQLLRNKYRLIQDIVIEKGLLIKLIMNLKYNKFKKLNSYSEYLTSKKVTNEEILNPSDEVLINEILNFCEVI